jgi:hypothetical protein
MALSQTGATYRNRAYILAQGRFGQLIADALDDIASQAQATQRQGNFSKAGTPSPPSAPTAVQGAVANRVFTASIIHPNSPKGTQWVLQYSLNDPQFGDTNTITETLMHPVWQKYLPNGTVFIRAAAKFQASEQSAWVYLGSSASPQGLS